MVVNIPTKEPAYTSLKKCCDKYILEYATVKAIVNNKNSIHLFFVSNAKEKYKAKAEVVCPEGKLLYI